MGADLSPTKESLLDAAERLFALHGFEGTSLRALTAAAGANLAAVHYHFGSKEDLAKAVMERRVQPINRERLRRLAELTARPQPATPREVLQAFIEPVFADLARLDSYAMRCFCRILVEQPPFLRSFFADRFRELAQRFARALGDAQPGLGYEEAFWRLHFVVGAMSHTLQNAAIVGVVSDGVCDASNPDAIAARLLEFAEGGLAHPPGRHHDERRT